MTLQLPLYLLSYDFSFTFVQRFSRFFSAWLAIDCSSFSLCSLTSFSFWFEAHGSMSPYFILSRPCCWSLLGRLSSVSLVIFFFMFLAIVVLWSSGGSSTHKWWAPVVGWKWITQALKSEVNSINIHFMSMYNACQMVFIEVSAFVNWYPSTKSKIILSLFDYNPSHSQGQIGHYNSTFYMFLVIFRR